MLEGHPQAGKLNQRIDNRLNHSPVCFHFRSLVLLDEGCQGRYQSDDFLLGHLHAATEELGGVGLGCSRLDEIGTANQYAAALGAANAFAAAVDHHIGSGSEVAVQVSAGRQHGSSINDDRHAVGVGNFADGLQGQNPVAGEGSEKIGDGGGALVDSSLQLPGVREEVVAKLDQACAGGPVGLVVREAVHGVDGYFVLQAIGVGKLAHLHRVVAGYDRRCLQY